MYRRAVLASAGTALLAGCTSLAPEQDSGQTVTAGPVTLSDVELPVPEEEFTHGASRDAIPAITDPAFGEDWAGISMTIPTDGGTRPVEPRLDPEERVVGVTHDGQARAYPLRLLQFHEVVNDNFGEPLLVTYCPLCGVAITAERRVDGRETIFGVSGLL